MPKPRKRTGSVPIPIRALVIIARELSSTYRAFVKPQQRWQVTVGRLEPSKEELSKLNLTGRREYCDRCGVAHARFHVKLPNGHELHFCGHHYHKHKFAFATYEVTELPDES